MSCHFSAPFSPDILPWISSLGCQVSGQPKSGLEYRGNASTTETGLTCKNWSDVASYNALPPRNYTYTRNYCRNRVKTRLWCWTTDDSQKWWANEWEYCNFLG